MSMDVKTNLDVMGEVIGNLAGMTEALEELHYLDELLTEAHQDASELFDLAAAATARAGYMSHMFEYGSAGITRGQVKFPDPSAQAARLWKHTLTGGPASKEAAFMFRPATVRNPPHTTASTGVPSKYLKRLSKRKYIFWNRAFVMESGMSVQIKSNRGDMGFLFIPTPGKNEPRNHIYYPSKLKGPVETTPGRKSQGQFTAFWANWWEKAGREAIEKSTGGKISVDVEIFEKKMNTEVINQPMKPPAANKINAEAQSARRSAKKAFGKGT